MTSFGKPTSRGRCRRVDRRFLREKNLSFFLFGLFSWIHVIVVRGINPVSVVFLNDLCIFLVELYSAQKVCTFYFHGFDTTQVIVQHHLTSLQDPRTLSATNHRLALFSYVSSNFCSPYTAVHKASDVLNSVGSSCLENINENI